MGLGAGAATFIEDFSSYSGLDLEQTMIFSIFNAPQTHQLRHRSHDSRRRITLTENNPNAAEPVIIFPREQASALFFLACE